jgi:uncharacterized protein (DUF3820 family)
MIMSFGKFKGTEVSELKPDYRKWLLTQDWFEKFTDLRLEFLELEEEGDTVSEPVKKSKPKSESKPAPKKEEDDNEEWEF